MKKSKITSGGIETLADLKGRCVVDVDSGCWHIRSARGKAYEHQPGVGIRIYSKVLGHSTVLQLAWALSRPGEEIPAGHKVYRTCCSHDCAAPRHIATGTAAQIGQHHRATGVTRTAKKTAAIHRMAVKRSVLNAELRRWLVESTQNAEDAAHGLGITGKRARGIRAGERRMAISQRPAASIFDFAYRRAA